MICKIKKLWKLFVLSPRGKYLVFSFFFFLVFGFVVEIINDFVLSEECMEIGLSIPLGAAFMIVSPSMFMQAMNGYGIYSFCTSSSKRRKMLLDYPVWISGIFMIIIYTIVVVLRFVAISLQPEYEMIAILQLLFVDCIIVIVGAYSGMAYKYFWITYVVFIVAYTGILIVMINADTLLSHGFLAKAVAVSFPVIVVIGYVAIAVSIFLNYIFARFLYRKPTSKWSVYGVRKR
ncbi:MAG: hypothetical protein K6G05_08755 [Lachnospiraceae bacterium]|nr:hypothetical protein [Lachnospiraceae bacterium]